MKIRTYMCDRSHFPFETLLSLFSYLLAKTFLAHSACKGEICRWVRMPWVWVPLTALTLRTFTEKTRALVAQPYGVLCAHHGRCIPKEDVSPLATLSE